MNIDLDLNPAIFSDQLKGEHTRHEIQHGVQADRDPVGFIAALTAGPGDPRYQALETAAEAFANQQAKNADAPDMSQDQAEKAVRNALETS